MVKYIYPIDDTVPFYKGYSKFVCTHG